MSVAFPLGAAVTVPQLDRDPHTVHHRLRAAETRARVLVETIAPAGRGELRRGFAGPMAAAIVAAALGMGDGEVDDDEIASNAAVLLSGGSRRPRG
jgi:hypothetical protein